MREGWKCPNCGKAHGPHVDTCPVPAYAAPFQPVPGTYIPPTTVTLPFVGNPPWEPTTGGIADYGGALAGSVPCADLGGTRVM